jgi:hypothetical protein
MRAPTLVYILEGDRSSAIRSLIMVMDIMVGIGHMAFMTTMAGTIAQFIMVIGATTATIVTGKLSIPGNNH